MESTTVRRPCYTEEEDGLSLLEEMEAGFSGHSLRRFQHHPSLSRRNSFRNLSLFSSPCSSPRFRRVYQDARFEEHEPHFLESCFLCKKPLGHDRDIFMYRGDTPFCSEECRQEQIEIDEAKDKSWNASASMKALRSRNDSKKSSSSSSPTKTQNYPYRAGTVAAA
ncbi:hypothetical protein Nepgr_031631 [Nepenthes gracilis]|uniref:FLZ-type domain-containing protein n=1 Tax=Nepenthes gracilis TaxID=150966 RepID=A0AAD3Y5A7_NEPGR|nr:hypothetical protein Nepgr_031631 [Nepenthes gracilis]